jgi:hypothetical protein
MAADIRALWAAVRQDALSRIQQSTPAGTQASDPGTTGVTSSGTGVTSSSTGVAPPGTSAPAPPPPCSSLLIVGHSMGGALGVWAAIGTTNSSTGTNGSSQQQHFGATATTTSGPSGSQGTGPASGPGGNTGSGQQGPQGTGGGTGSTAPPSAAKIVAANLPGLAGVVVIDVVEGTAIGGYGACASLPHNLGCGLAPFLALDCRQQLFIMLMNQDASHCLHIPNRMQTVLVVLASTSELWLACVAGNSMNRPRQCTCQLPVTDMWTSMSYLHLAAALPHMGSVIAARPTSFGSPSEAAAWALKSGMARCKEAAAISIPSQVGHTACLHAVCASIAALCL